MGQEEKIVIAFLFKRSGKNKLKETEIYLPLSIELGWFSMIDARLFIESALKQNLLVKTEDLFSPTFDIENAKIPPGFIPSKFSYEALDNDLTEGIFDKIVYRIIEKTNKSSQEVIKEINQIQTEKNIIPEIAALFSAIELNVKIADLLNFVEKKIFKENV